MSTPSASETRSPFERQQRDQRVLDRAGEPGSE
jgi:hypothetical protein